MGFGLYEPAFATVTGLYGREARGPITGITLFAGFASTVGWRGELGCGGRSRARSHDPLHAQLPER